MTSRAAPLKQESVIEPIRTRGDLNGFSVKSEENSLGTSLSNRMVLSKANSDTSTGANPTAAIENERFQLSRQDASVMSRKSPLGS
uniref:Uncharacterized protein n=1 Tax=Ditylenchus dipsaci TaxID=166011 RepID=A0A915DMI4_9BILA